MRRANVRYSLALIAACIAILSAAAPAPAEAGCKRPDMICGLRGLSALPQGEFKKNVEDPGWGIDMDFFFRVPSSPVWIGCVFGGYVYGSEEREEPFSETIPDVTVRVETTNNLLQSGLIVRMMPPGARFRPYLDGFLGFNYLFTSTSINYRESGEEIASDTKFDDATICYGAGGGFLLTIHSERTDAGTLVSLSIDLSGRYLAGGEAQYLKEGSIIREDSRIVYETYQSKTSIVQIALGLTLGF